MAGSFCLFFSLCMQDAGVLITVSGYPCSGKSTRVSELVAFLRSKTDKKIVVLSDEALSISKAAYDNSRAEKPARAALFSAVTRDLNKETIVIVDAMNYIKGSRYQMYCAARELICRTLTLYVIAPADQCRTWNEARSGDKYDGATLENLIQRFEEPNSSARWDSPLVTATHLDPPLEEAPQLQNQIWEAITNGYLKPPNVATLPVLTSSTSYLTRLESTISSVITVILERQTLAGPITCTTLLSLSVDGKDIEIAVTLRKKVTMPLCQRLKKQFVKLNAQAGKEMENDTIAKLFVQYLESNV